MTALQIFDRHPGIARFEEEIRCLTDREVVGIFTSQGELLHRYVGYYYNGILRVEIPDADRLISQGQILTHNHLSDTSFSLHDLETAAKFNLAEIRVVGETGVCSMMPSRDGWPEPGAIVEQCGKVNADPEFRSRIYRIQYNPEFRVRAKDVYKNTMRIRSHLHCQQVAEALGLIYKGARWGDCASGVRSS